MKEKTFTMEDLVSFGNYLLSEERNASIESPEMKGVVGDWDTDRQPYTIPQQRKAYKVLHATKFDLMVYSPTNK